LHATPSGESLMIRTSNIRSLSEFQRNAKQHIRRLKKTGRPEVLTVNGRAQVVVQSAEAYQKLLDDAEMLETVKILKKSLAEADRGEGRPADEVFDEIRAKYGLPARGRK